MFLIGGVFRRDRRFIWFGLAKVSVDYWTVKSLNVKGIKWVLDVFHAKYILIKEKNC